MQLVLLFGDEAIDRLWIDLRKLHQAEYIICLQEELIQRNEEALEHCCDAPSFAIENVPSKMSFTSLMATS